MSSVKPQFKVVLIGESGVGKTSLMEKFVHKRFLGSYKSTIGADFLTQDLIVDGKSTTLQIWDTAGQERWNSLGKVFYRGADCCILVCDVTRPQSLQELKFWRGEFQEHADINSEEDCLFYVFANRVDLPNREITTADAKQWCVDNGDLPLYETSAKTGQNVEKAFYDIIRQLNRRGKVNVGAIGQNTVLTDIAQTDEGKTCC